MPSKPMSFEKAVIYKLVCNDLNIPSCYVGSTTNFSKRKGYHKGNCKNINSKDYNYPVYKCIRQNGGWNNWSMILLEKYPCKDRLELESRERYHMELLKTDLNKNIPTRTSKEYYQVTKEVFLAKCKVYRQKNSEIIKVKRSKIINCECGIKYTYGHTHRHKKSLKHKKYLLNMEHNNLIVINNQLDKNDLELTSEFNRLCSLINPLI